MVAEPTAGGGLVDAHLHLWDPQRLAIGWLRGVPRLDRRVIHDDYAAAARPLGIGAAVIVEAAVDDTALEDEVAWIHEQVASDGLVTAGVAGWRPAGDAGRTTGWLDRLAETPGVVGVREVLHPEGHPASDPAEPSRIRSIREAGDRGLVVDLCVRPDQLAAVETLLAEVPETTVVLDHLGRPRSAEPVSAEWQAMIARLATHPNLRVKISALVECAEGRDWTPDRFRPFIEIVLDAFGPDRAMWGSNWPMCVDDAAGLAGWLDAARLACGRLDEAGRSALFGGTARRIYGLAAD